MSLKLKVLSTALVATMALGAVAVINASATVNGHFTNDAPGGHALIKGTESLPNHFLQFRIGENTPIRCTTATYSGTVSTATTEEITVAPSYDDCETNKEGAIPDEVHVDPTGCHFVFRSNSGASTHDPTAHATVTLVCPAGVKGIDITHTGAPGGTCHIVVPAHQSLSGITYTTVTAANGKHEITLNSTVSNITTHYESGFCIFLGTKQTSTMTGSATVRGTDTDGVQVNITAT